MVRAIVFGMLASAGLVLGSLVGIRFRIPERLLAVLLAFASGSLITALAFELYADSFEQGGAWLSGVGLIAGAIVFVVVSAWLDRHVATAQNDEGSPKIDTAAAAQEEKASPSRAGSAAGFALLAAVTLDGVPENLALGISLAEETGGLVLLVAIFLSNFPESLVGSASMREQGRSAAFVVFIWCATGVLLTLSVLIGRGVLVGSSPGTVSLPLAFAGGAVVASLADTLMPEAYEHGGPPVALATAGGFLVSFLLSTI
jgi:ZIP family zinc transporter